MASMVFGRYDYANFLTFICYAACSVSIPILLLPLAQSLDFPLDAAGGKSAGGALQLGRSIPMIGSMVLCGFAAGRWGKVKTLGYSLFFMAGGIMLAAATPNYAVLFLALAVAGIGEGVCEGLATPVIQDLHPEEPGRYINFSHGFWSVGVLSTMILVGFLLLQSVSWRWILLVVGSLSTIPALMYVWPAGKSTAHPDDGNQLHYKQVLGHAGEIMAVPRFWLFFAAMFLAGGGEFCLTFWLPSLIQLNYAGSPLSGGFGTGCFAVGMIVARLGWGYFIRQRHLKQLVVYSALGGAALNLLVPVLSSVWLLFAVCFLLGVATGPFWPSVQSYCVDRVRGDSTMMLILLSCAGVPGCGFFSWFMGYVGDHWDLRQAFYLVSICYFGLALLIIWDWLTAKGEERSVGDQH